MHAAEDILIDIFYLRNVAGWMAATSMTDMLLLRLFQLPAPRTY
jgi:hypothetical protein